MISLKNGCYRSQITVIPQNWDFDPEKALAKFKEKTVISTIEALLQLEWRISYRFYDPAFKGTKLWGKKIQIKGMNKFKSLQDRQDFTKTTIDELLSVLDKEGYNPITKKFALEELQTEIDSDTPLSIALKEAHKKLKCAQGTKDDIERALVHIQAAITELRLTTTPVGEIKIRECIIILDKVREMKLKKRDADIALLKITYNAGKIDKVKFAKEMKKLEKYDFGASSYNHYRSYLRMLFKVIVPLANLAGNPINENIPKEKGVKKIRDVLTNEQRKLINDYLQKKYFKYWRFLQIFFHSGGRITEMLRVELAHVDLKKQRFKALILKGNAYEEVWKVIKDIALPYWQEAVEEASKIKSNGQPIYLFSRNQKPGLTIINEEQISRRWLERVKHKPELGNVTADFYSLKHLNSTETKNIGGSSAAAAQNSHKSVAMVDTVYDVLREERLWEEQEKLKQINNSFA